MPANYKYFDAQGQERTIYSVLDPVALTGVATNVTSGTENRVIVTTTAALFPGMAVSIPNIPQGAFIHAVRSATEIELWATAWNATTGVFTTSATNANAIAAATGLTGHALGFSPRCFVTLTYAMGTWRNLHSRTANILVEPSTSSSVLAAMGAMPGAGVVPSTVTVSAGGAVTMATATMVTSDDLAATPLKRHNGEPWGVYQLVSSLGHISNVQAVPGREILYLGPST